MTENLPHPLRAKDPDRPTGSNRDTFIPLTGSRGARMSGNRWPNLFLAGAAKAGTTSLHRYLDGHPDIAMSRPKETYFFTDTWDEAKDDKHTLDQEIEAYLGSFEHAAEERYLGESTPGYLWHPDVAQRIADRCKDPRFIVSLRDPIERAHSDWAMARRRSGEVRTFHERISDEIDPDPANPTPRGVVNPGRYGTHLDRIIGTFGKERVHVLLFEDLKKDPLVLLKSIAAFLEIDQEAMAHVDYETVHNPYGEARNRFAAWARESSHVRTIAQALLPETLRIWLGEHVLVKQTEKPPLDPEAKAKLEAYYEPEIQRAEALLDRDLPELRKTWDTGTIQNRA